MPPSGGFCVTISLEHMKQKVKITPGKLRRVYYQENISATMVAKHFNCSPTTIRNYLDKYGFRVKRHSEVMKGRKLTKEHRDKIVSNLNNFKGG